MKKLILIFVVSSLVACQSKKEPVSKAYGDAILTNDAAPLASLTSQVEGKDSVTLTLKGTIEKTCAKKGCWMSVQDANGVATRVTFKNYGFFVPLDSTAGKEVVFSGVAKRKITDVPALRHFAEDAGKTQAEIEAIVTPKEEIEFVANGVVIYEKDSDK